MNLDLIAAFGCFWLVLIVGTLHAVSSPRRPTWITLPQYVRGGFVVTEFMFLWRGVNFATLAPAQLGHVNPEGLMALLALTYTVTALAVWVVRSQLPNQGWARLDWMRRVMRARPDMVPVALTQTEVVQAHRIMGAYVATAPGQGLPDGGGDTAVETPAYPNRRSGGR